MTIGIALLAIAMGGFAVLSTRVGWRMIDAGQRWRGITLLVIIAGFCAIPLIAERTHVLSVKEWGEWHQRKPGSQITIRDPKILKFQGRLYKCELIEDDKSKKPQEENTQ